MIVAVLIVGMLLVSTSLRGTEKELAQQLQIDMFGNDGFVLWAASLAAVGAVGYIPGLRKTSLYLLVLIGVVILLRNGGLFSQAKLALQATSVGGPAPSISQPETGASPGTQQPAQQSSNSSSGAGGALGGIASLAPLALALL